MMLRIAFRLLLLSLAAAGWHTSGRSAARADELEPFTKAVQPFLEQHCGECHGAEEQQAGLRYDRLKGYFAADRDLWTIIHEQIASGSMPPKDRPRPTEAERTRVLAWIEESQQRADHGRMRRLNRRELSAALGDVTGLSADFAYSLPGDGRVDGFDTGATGLQDSADSVAQVLQVTRRAVESIRFREPDPGKRFTADLTIAKDARQAFDPWKSEGVSAGAGDTIGRPGTGLLIAPKWLGDRGGLNFKIPPAAERSGVLRLEVEVSSLKFVKGVPHPHLWVEIGGIDVAYEEIDNAPEEPRTLVFEVLMSDLTVESRGVSITLTNRVEVPYAVPGFENEEKGKPEENLPGGTGLFRPLYDRKSVPLEEQPVPFLVLHRIDIAVDHRAAWPPAAWGLDPQPTAEDDSSAERLLRLWTERAWRRPVTDAELSRFLEFHHNLRREGRSFDDALRAACQAVLMSGSFRYLVSPGRFDSEETQFALASRLSFMLWGSPPDEELRNLAAAGRLRDDQVLAAQVDRLLADPRGKAFLRPFTMQWLEMGQPITVAMDHLQKQDFRFGRNLKASMQQETIAYVERLFAENRPAGELLLSDWTMMNEILARHYGYQEQRDIEGKRIEGGRLRPVLLRRDDPRGGGILGHAGIQSMLCWMGENWVIYRGAWVLRQVLDDPPPPPPLEVPELTPSESKNRGKPFRELLAQHQEDRRCAVCHVKMDPLGFAFQNFDLSGRWREVEYDHYVKNDLDGKIEWRGEGKTRPVDTRGRLPRGEEFASYPEFKRLLREHYTADVARGLAKNLIVYGTGRRPDIEDLRHLKQLLANLEPRGYPLREVLRGVVLSRAFREK